jgi:hypothetical protein
LASTGTFTTVVGATAAALVLASCGGSSPSATTAAAARPAEGPGGFALTSQQRACLKREGVTLPTRPSGNRRPPAGGAPPQGYGPPPDGAGPPQDGSGAPPARGGDDSSHFGRLRAAMQKCGITFRGRRGGGQPQPNGNSATTSNS